MSTISGLYNASMDYSYLFSSLSTSSSSSSSSSDILGIDYTDYALIQNGTYKKMLEVYYAQDTTDSSDSEESAREIALLQSDAAALKKSADALNSAELWEKIQISGTDEETGEITETEDYDWDAITSALQSLVDSYNDTLEQAADSDNTKVLRNTVWLTQTVAANENLLSEAGITIGTDNKLELDTEKLQEADISTLKTLFYGYNSLSSKISQKATAISNAAAGTGNIYTSNGTYITDSSSLLASIVDVEA